MPIHISNRNNRAYLDTIRNRFGMDALRRTFHDTCGTDEEKAGRLINDTKIKFPTFFVLRPEIIKTGFYTRLNNRNRGAFDLCGEILAGEMASERKGRGTDQNALLWMLETGHASDGLGEQYDQVMDTTALLLAKVHKHKGCLHPLESLIFRRHRKGAFTYDLIWAFFEASEPDDLLMIAQRLKSANARDVELARKLLNFVPCIADESNQTNQYHCAAKWIRQNKSRLYYTGETNQQHSNPRRYALVGEDRQDEPTEDSL